MPAKAFDVVIVDDAPDAAEAMAMSLELDGYRVKVETDAHAALAHIEQSPPLCVILDFSMPGLDGLDLTRRLRQRFGDDIVLVAVTGHSPDNARVADTFARVDHYFTKPVSAAQIRKCLPPVD